MNARTLATTLTLGAGLLLPSIAVGQPTLVWETTVSVTSQLEGADDMVVDAAGNVIVTGYLPVEQDFFVLKFDPAGDLQWSRIIGGTGIDHASGLAVDDAGDIYLAGRSLSDDFPVQQAYQATKNGSSDAILMKLAGGDGSTVFSTYFGGSRSEWAHDLALGPDGTITIVGQTGSTNLETVDAIQDSLTLIECFCDDAFVTTFSPDGDAVLFSTYLGGTFDDLANDVTVDTAGNITVAGRTKSADFPVMNAAQPAHGGGEFDAFVARITADRALAYSTFLGGEDWELVQGMDVDADGAVYVTGSTRSVSYPTTPGAFQEDFVGGILACEVPFGQDQNCYDMFVTKLAPDGSYGYSTFIGGDGADEPRNVVVDQAGRAHVVGYTYSQNFPLGAPFGNVVALRLDPAGGDLDYVLAHSTPGSNAGSAVAVHGEDLFIATSVGLPYDAYVAKFSSGDTSSPCSGDLDGSGEVGFSDILQIIAAWGPCDGAPCPADLDEDGEVGFADMLMLLGAWGPCP
jgi:hypothetical protein